MCQLVYGSHVALGWGCCQSRHYNGLQRGRCKTCNHERCIPLSISADWAVYREEGQQNIVKIVHCYFESYDTYSVFNLRLKALDDGLVPAGREFTINCNVKYAASHGAWSLEPLKEVGRAFLAENCPQERPSSI